MHFSKVVYVLIHVMITKTSMILLLRISELFIIHSKYLSFAIPLDEALIHSVVILFGRFLPLLPDCPETTAQKLGVIDF